jgi:hypothetical protein
MRSIDPTSSDPGDRTSDDRDGRRSAESNLVNGRWQAHGRWDCEFRSQLGKRVEYHAQLGQLCEAAHLTSTLVQDRRSTPDRRNLLDRDVDRLTE